MAMQYLSGSKGISIPSGVDDCPEYDDPEDPDSEDQGTCVNITTSVR